MASEGVRSAIELGHGSVIKGLVRRIDKELVVRPIGSPDDLQAKE